MEMIQHRPPRPDATASHPSLVVRVLKHWSNVLAIDLRSLAAFRVGVGLLILTDLACRVRDVPAFLTDQGLLSRSVRLEMLIPGDPEALEHQWSLHMFSGQAWAQWSLMAVAALFAAWLVIGYRTQVAALVSWVLLVSLGNRNPLIFDAGDAVLRCMLFWALFVPLGARFSMDARRRRKRSEPAEALRSSILSFGSAALLLQLLVVYTSAALHKLNPVWTSEFSGVYYALNCDPFVTRLGLFIREYPAVMKMLTASTFALELCGPVLLLVPVANRWIRMAAVLAFGGFHLGLAGTMTLGLFPWICLVCWFLFVPGMAWDRLERLIHSWLATRPFALRALRTGGTNADGPSETQAWPHTIHSALRRRVSNAAAGCLLAYALLWNLRDVFDEGTANRILPQRWNAVARALGLEKGWSMFAPVPRPDDGWPVYRGILHDGTEVNLWEPDQPLPWQKPPIVSDLYKNQRWRRYLENLTMESYAWYRPYFADWLQQRWDARYAKGRPERRVATVEFLRQLEPTPPPGEPMPPPETAILWTKHYADLSSEPTHVEMQEP